MTTAEGTGSVSGMEHELSVESNVSYPGGKNGWSRAWCSCDPFRFWWGHNDAAALKPAKAHKEAKENQS